MGGGAEGRTSSSTTTPEKIFHPAQLREGARIASSLKEGRTPSQAHLAVPACLQRPQSQRSKGDNVRPNRGNYAGKGWSAGEEEEVLCLYPALPSIYTSKSQLARPLKEAPFLDGKETTSFGRHKKRTCGPNNSPFSEEIPPPQKKTTSTPFAREEDLLSLGRLSQ